MNIESIIVALISSGTVGAIMTAVVKAVVKRITEEDPQRVGMRLLLQEKLTCLCREALKADNISFSSYTLIHRMYDSYHELGGNGDMAHLMAAIDKLDVYVDSPDK